MGLLDRLIKKITNDLTDKASDKIADSISDAVMDSLNMTEEEKAALKAKKEAEAKAEAEKKAEEAAKKAEQAAQAAAAGIELDDNGYPVQQVPHLNVKHSEPVIPDASAVPSALPKGDVSYFADLIEKNLPGAALEKNVPLASVVPGATSWNVNIDLLLRKAGAPALAVMIVGKNYYNRMAIVNTMNACEGAGIPAIRFIKEFSNEPSYVIGRIKGLMK